MEEFITQFKNRLNERITFLTGNEAPYQFIRFVMMSSNPEDEQLYIPVDKKAQEKYAKNIEDAIQKAIDTEIAKTQESDMGKHKKAQSS